MKYHTDSNTEPTKEVRSWNGIPLNITTKIGEARFLFGPPMTCDYGCIRGSWGAGLDGKALDVYVVSDAPTVFKVVQITSAGAIDEYKYVLGAQNFDEAVETFLKHVPKQLFGAASQYSIAQLQEDIVQQSKVKKDADELTDFVEQLEAFIESDDTYGSNVYVLSFEVADNGDITGKFEDAWNGRVFSYSVQKDRIGYKPALTLDRKDDGINARLFDLFSAGYTSLGIRQDATKSGKKPRCTAVSYSCGRACIQLKNTCWINSSGQKVKKAGGSVASISQGRIDKLRTLARYLATGGINKWSKYSAENLTTKANILEQKRTALIKTGVKTELPMQAKLAKITTPKPEIEKSNSKSLTRKTPEKTTINNTHDVIPLRKNVNESILVDKIASLTGMKTEEARSSLYAVSKFTSTHYTYYRETERTGKPMPNASDQSISAMTQQVEAVNRYLDKMPKFDGSVYRGLTFESQKIVDNFVKKLKEGNFYQIDAMSSFSSSIDVAKKFATPNSQAELPSVAFKVLKNRSGVTIKSLSSLPEEDEVLVPKGAKYKLAGNVEYLKYKGKKITIIPLEEY